MMPKGIQRLMARGAPEDVVGNMMYNLMSNFNLSYEETLKLPLPVALSLLKKLNAENKKMNKQMKRKR